MTLKSGLDVTQDHSERIGNRTEAFESFGAVFYSPSIVTITISRISSELKPDIGRKS